MAYVGETYRVHYMAKNFAQSLLDVRMVVYKPNGVKQGIYTLTELNAGDGKGIYYYDYDDSDLEGSYLFVVNSPSTPKKDARQVFFEKRLGWSDTERMQIRDALGIGGDKLLAAGGQLQDIKIDTGTIRSDVTIIKNDVDAIRDDVAVLIADVQFIKDIEGGKWEIKNNQMIFYKNDNTTEVARFNLFNDINQPAMEHIFKRNRV